MLEKQLKLINKFYVKCSIWAKLLILVSLFMLVVLIFKGLNGTYSFKEGFQQTDQFLFKTGPEIYDKFYAEIYDYLVYNNLKNEYEVGEIVNKTSPSSQSKVLDIGCGTGHHVASLASKGMNVIGIDISPAMIEQAKTNYPDYNFTTGDALNSNEFTSNSFTHIICMYFTIYYLKDRNKFFQNSMKWLMPGGYLILHLVDRKHFDPILPPGNPLMLVSPQKYSKERITTTKVKFTDFAYNAEFQLDEQNNIARFVEKFKNDNDGKIRKNEHIMYMPETKVVVDEALNAGFILFSQVDLLNCQYEYQYLYIFTKPN
jgi:ubiquinone/menaquinone biosynthesis C-methylase UbiE